MACDRNGAQAVPSMENSDSNVILPRSSAVFVRSVMQQAMPHVKIEVESATQPPNRDESIVTEWHDVSERNQHAGTSRWRRQLLKIILLAAVILILVFFGQSVRKAVASLRGFLNSLHIAVPLALYCLINCLRKLFPPIYFVIPITWLAYVFLSDRFGPELGSVILQALRLQELLHFLVLSQWYKGVAAALFGDETGALSWASRCIPSEIAQALSVLDVGWRNGPYGTLESSWRQSMAAYAFQASWFVDELVNIWWLSTRSGATMFTYARGLIPGLLAQYPKTLFWMRTYGAVTDAVTTENDGVQALVNGLKSIPWYQLLPFAIIGGLATLVVYGNNVRIVTGTAWRFALGLWHTARNHSSDLSQS